MAMPKLFAPMAFLLVATVLEASGDAVIRMGLGAQATGARVGFFLAGAGLVFGYGLMLNLAPLEFGRVVGLYIATLFVVWQVVNAIAFRASPTLPVLAGGVLIIVGGLIVSFWTPGGAT